MQEVSTYDVIVIGGGFAGVTAARDLTAAGYRCVVLEARDRVGGRTLTKEFRGLNERVEHGGFWVLPSTQHNVARELSRYGLNLIQSPSPEKVQWFLDGRLRPGFPMGRLDRSKLEAALVQMQLDARRIDHSRPLDEQDLGDLDISLSEFVARQQLPPVARDFVFSLGVVYGGCHATDNSYLHILLDLIEFEYSLSAFVDGLDDQIAEGTDTLIASMVSDGVGDLRMSAVVTSVRQDKGGVTATIEDGTVFKAGAAVVAMPVNVWDSVEFTPPLSVGKAAVASARHGGQAVKIWALVKGAPANVLASGVDLPVVWWSTERRLAEGDLLVGFGTASDTHPLDIAGVQRSLDALIPGATAIAVDGHDWANDPFARGGWAWYRPGQLSQHHGDLRRSEGRLIFAGSDIADEWMSWIDGAIGSGGDAAVRVANLLTARTGEQVDLRG